MVFFNNVWQALIVAYDFVVANWELITKIGSTLIAFLVTVLGWSKTVSKNKKWNNAVTKISEFMAKIDGQRLTGLQKKELVMEKAKEICKITKVKYNEEKISNLIEDIVLITKKINARQKDTQK